MTETYDLIRYQIVPPLFLFFFTVVTQVSSQCLKITEKVSFNIASEASYVFILSGQKFIKNAKNGPFWRVLEKLENAVKQCYQTTIRQNAENATIKKSNATY